MDTKMPDFHFLIISKLLEIMNIIETIPLFEECRQLASFHERLRMGKE